MYSKGDLKIYAGKENMWVREISDSRDNNRDIEKGETYLPHSCDEWVIGGKEQIEALIADLYKALQYIELREKRDSG